MPKRRLQYETVFPDAIKKKFKELVDKGRIGFTLDLEGDEFYPRYGYAVAYKSFPLGPNHEGVEKAIESVSFNDFIGFWVDPETNECFVELVKYERYELTAALIAQMANQKYIYHFKRGKVIPINVYETGEGICQ